MITIPVRSTGAGSRRPIRDPTYPPTTEPAASSTTAAQSRSADEDEDHAGHHVAGHHGQRLERVDDPELEVQPEPEDGHHHHAGAGAEVAAVHAGQGREEPGHRRHRGARLRRLSPVPGAQPGGDPRLGADQQAGEEDQPRHHGLEDLRRQRQQQYGARDGPDRAGDEHRGCGARLLPQLAAVAPRPAEAPGVRPTVLEAFATTGGSPTASSTGKLSSDATPTVEVKIPAPNPAARTARCSRPLIVTTLVTTPRPSAGVGTALLGLPR